MPKKIRMKNISGGDLSVADLGLALSPDEEKDIPKVSTVEEALEIPSIQRHVSRRRLKIIGDSAPKKASAPKGKPKSSIKEAVKKAVTKKPRTYTKKELEGMKMDKLRKIGKPLGAKDTKKSELISEILKAQKKRG